MVGSRVSCVFAQFVKGRETQKGIKDVLLEQWRDKSTGLDDKKFAEELVESHFNKACASCHINQKEDKLHFFR